MSVTTRLFDFAHHALYKFLKEDALVTKYNEFGQKLCQKEYRIKENKILEGICLKLELNREIKSANFYE